MGTGLDVLADRSIAVLVFATLAAAWSWLGSYAGIVSFGHAIFFGIGAYAVAASNFRGGSPWYGALGGALLAVALAVVCGLVFLRGRGYVFGLVTLVLGALAEPLVAAQSWLGPHEAYVFPVRTGFLNLQFAQKWPYVLLALAVFGVAQALTLGLRSSRIGYSLRALRSAPDVARSVGVSALPPRLAVLAGSAFVTSAAGSFFAQYTLAVAPHLMFGLPLALDIALLGVVAGSGSPWGALIAGLLYVSVTSVAPLHPSGGPGTVILVIEGAIVVLVVLLRPQGMFAALRRPAPVEAARAAG
jgi:branched-chain amino acid transport system permease protein